MGRLTKEAARSAFVMAYVFGSTSANIKTKTVITNVASTTALSPKLRASNAVVRDVARIFTRLLPKRTDPIRRSLSSVTSRARCAPRDPLSACARNFPREAAVRAVSLPEKNPERISRAAIADTEIQNSASKRRAVSSMVMSVL